MSDTPYDHSWYICMDCSADTNKHEQYYALKDRLWRRINPAVDGMLCLPCAEKRLGRPLSRPDFKDVPVNAKQALICPELALRLNRDP
jgi:hypothetical protein